MVQGTYKKLGLDKNGVQERSAMLVVCVLEQIKPSPIVAARRRAIALSLEALPPAGQRST